MKISVVVPIYNEEKHILACLASLLAQTVSSEIIVVDDGSTDKSLMTIHRFAALHRVISLYKRSHEGPAAARNFGAEKARGDVLVFVDADMTFAHDFIEQLTAPLIEGNEKGTFTKAEYVQNWDTIWAKCWNYNQGIRSSLRVPKDYPDTAPVFRALLKSEFDRVGGYTSGVGWVDDWTLSEKLGYKSVATRAECYHSNPDTLKEINEHARWIGKSTHISGSTLKVCINLLRYSFLVSMCTGILGSIIYFCPHFFIFKLVYDAGVYQGIVDILLGAHRNK